jgi:hypothetical protein
MSWLSSPLAATAIVCAGLAAISMPLRKLTSTTRQAAVAAAAKTTGSPTNTDHPHEMTGVLRLRLLNPARSLRISTTGGRMLWSAENLDAGETETDAGFSLHDDSLELRVEADFGPADGDTALFLTVMPDGIEEQTRHAIGSGKVNEILHYEWNIH